MRCGAKRPSRVRTCCGVPGPIAERPHRGMSKICRMGRGWQICSKPTAPKLAAPIRSGFGSSTTRSMTDANTPDTYRLFTTILDPDEAGAIELAAAYGCRWEIEVAFDELKTHQRGPRTVLRSKSPDLVLQEIWGHLCCHFAIRSLMADTAAHTGHDPQRLSFVAALRITRQSIAHQGDFSLTTLTQPTAAGSPSHAGSPHA